MDSVAIIGTVQTPRVSKITFFRIACQTTVHIFSIWANVDTKDQKKLTVAVGNNTLARKEINTTPIFLNQMCINFLLVSPNCVKWYQYTKNKKINQIMEDIYIQLNLLV